MNWKKTIGRFTFNIWRDRGFKLQGGRVLYHAARKWWVRIGDMIFSVEIVQRSKP